jgi:hypothetical protein
LFAGNRQTPYVFMLWGALCVVAPWRVFGVSSAASGYVVLSYRSWALVYFVAAFATCSGCHLQFNTATMVFR